MGSPPQSTVVCLDLLGTTASAGDASEQAVGEAIATQGLIPGTQAFTKAMVQAHRCWGAVDFFARLFPGDEARALAASTAFERAFTSRIARDGVEPIPGAVDAFNRLRRAGLGVCLLTSLPPESLQRVLDLLRWHSVADIVLSRHDGRRRPALRYAARRLGAPDISTVAVVGDATADIADARDEGAGTAIGVCTGIHPPTRLLEAGATHILQTVQEVPDLLLGEAPP